MQNRSDKNKKQKHIKNQKKFLQQEIQNTTDEKVKLELTKMLIDIDSRQKYKKRGLILTLFILLIIILVTLYVYGYKKEATSKSENITSNSLIEKNLWDENKEKELHSFIEVWGESMTQKYEKYSLDRPLYLNEVYIPNSIIGESPEIDVLINGKKQILNLFEGNSKTSDYKIVSVYSDIDDSQNESAEKHLYLFTFKGDIPTVLVSNLDGNPFDTLNFKDTENIDLKQGFDAIVYSKEIPTIFNKNDEFEDESRVEFDMSLYDTVLNRYEMYYHHRQEKIVPDTNPVTMILFDHNENTTLRYTLADLSGNGTDNLIIAVGENILDLYTISNGKVIRLTNDSDLGGIGERTNLYILNDHKFGYVGSGGAFDHYYAIYEFNHDGTELVKTNEASTSSENMNLPNEFNVIQDDRVDMNNFSWKEISKTGEVTTDRISSEDAIELAKKYMAGENFSMDLENYSFRPAADLIGDGDNPHYAIYVRQKASGGFNSMAIGTIYVNAKTGECHWA